MKHICNNVNAKMPKNRSKYFKINPMYKNIFIASHPKVNRKNKKIYVGNTSL